MVFHIWTREDWERYPEGMRPPAVEVIRDGDGTCGETERQ